MFNFLLDCTEQDYRKWSQYCTYYMVYQAIDLVLIFLELAFTELDNLRYYIVIRALVLAHNK
jgi:hypothetical protein